jgi:hypothetical protein
VPFSCIFGAFVKSISPADSYSPIWSQSFVDASLLDLGILTLQCPCMRNIFLLQLLLVMLCQIYIHACCLPLFLKFYSLIEVRTNPDKLLPTTVCETFQICLLTQVLTMLHTIDFDASVFHASKPIFICQQLK